MQKCPRCGDVKNVRLSRAEGFWERRVLRALGWYPYRCRGCGRRFYRMGSGGGRVRKRRREEANTKQMFAPSQPSESFEDVVEMVRRAEAEAERANSSSDDNLRSFPQNG